MQVLDMRADSTSAKINNLAKTILQEPVNAILNDPEHFKKMQEKISNAFTKSEQQNDEMISEIEKKAINQMRASILKAEEQNDDAINKIMDSITDKSKIENEDLTQKLGRLSADILDHLK